MLETFGRTLSEAAGKRPRAKRPDRSAARLKVTATKHRGRVSAATVRANVKDSAPDLTLAGKIVPPADQVRGVLSDRAVQVKGPGGKGTQVMLSSMPLATATAPTAGKPVSYRLADLDWKTAGDRYTISRPVQAVSLPKTAGGVARLGNGVAFRLADPGSDAPGTVSGETVTYPNIATDTDLVTRALPTGVGYAWSLRSPRSKQELRVGISVPAGRQLRKDDQGGVSVTGDKDDPATTITPAIAIDADGQRVPVSTRVEDDAIVYDVDHAEGTVAYPVTLDPLLYSQTFTAGQVADG
ncbi:hypothetical protein AB0L40_03320 [Patulibacter sp. NPDC049589]|uniref:hypothetical protein n=1 Tax=Patulibacter sp. NPDC049589 TaxID=3154731 RepID=UPI00342664E5